VQAQRQMSEQQTIQFEQALHHLALQTHEPRHPGLEHGI
jgi:hypothetical protein